MKIPFERGPFLPSRLLEYLSDVREKYRASCIRDANVAVYIEPLSPNEFALLYIYLKCEYDDIWVVMEISVNADYNQALEANVIDDWSRTFGRSIRFMIDHDFETVYPQNIWGTLTETTPPTLWGWFESDDPADIVDLVIKARENFFDLKPPHDIPKDPIEKAILDTLIEHFASIARSESKCSCWDLLERADLEYRKYMGLNRIYNQISTDNPYSISRSSVYRRLIKLLRKGYIKHVRRWGYAIREGTGFLYAYLYEKHRELWMEMRPRLMNSPVTEVKICLDYCY